MAGVAAGVLLLLLLILGPSGDGAAWPFPLGGTSGNRLAAGKGSFPRWQALALPTESPLRWLVVLSRRRLAAVDRDGTVWMFEVGRAGITVAARYGEVASPDGPPAVVGLDRARSGLTLVAPDGRLVVWSDGALRSYDVGTPLSRLAVPTPLALGNGEWDDLLAVAADGAVLLIGNLPAGPRVISRVDVHALPDARIAVADLDGDGTPEAVVLSDPTERYAHGALGDSVEAASVTVIGLSPSGLFIRARHAVPAPAVIEDLAPVIARVGEGVRPLMMVVRSSAQRGAAVVAFGWKDGGLELLAEGPAAGRGLRRTHVLGVANFSGEGPPEIVAVHTPHLGGVLTAYRRRGSALIPVAQASGYASHLFGSRNQDQALIADFDGNGRPEVVLPRQSREALAGLELEAGRFAERWSLRLGSRIESNLAAADLSGDGLVDLAVADGRVLRVFLSVR
ncbi:MAG: VCBS repeat-containing protein [Candidatus Rokubacteria bacterium]|nr:VCBS repeat-containing protein [Candidatus Rokubacteria bacterium]